jgi:CTP synthase (UTP-ammonia lyase)
MRLGVVADYDPGNETHLGTDAGLAHAGIDFEWVPTDEISPTDPTARLDGYAGLMIGPASPYRSMDGALAAVRLARERGVPLVAT